MSSPNILFLMTDQMQARVLEPDNSCRTPNLIGWRPEVCASAAPTRPTQSARPQPAGRLHADRSTLPKEQ